MGYKLCHLIGVSLMIHLFTKVSCSTLPISKKPNIVFILVDDLGWNDVSYHGSGQIPTPNIDALALSGLTLQNYYALPLCSPSRSALMTGKHPIRLGMQHGIHQPASAFGLPLDEVLLPQRLKSLGYNTHMVGKWHLGHHTKAFLPNSRGFDSFYGYYSGAIGFYDHFIQHPVTLWMGFDMRNNSDVDWSAYGKYATELLSEKAEAVIQAQDPEKPFFLYMSHAAAHVGNLYASLQAPAESIARFMHIEDPERRKYAAMMYELDKSVGRMVQVLSDKNLLEDTIIVFSSDNGGVPAPRPTDHTFDRNAGSNWPLRGAKNTTWEGGVKVNGFVWSPLIPKDRQGTIYNDLMDISDWLPTLYEAAGGENTELGSIDGISQWDSLIKGTPSNRTHLLHNIDDYFGYAGIRKENFKLIKGNTHNGEFDDWRGPEGFDNPAIDWSSTNQTLYRSQLKSSQVGKSLASLTMAFEKSDDEMNQLRQTLVTKCKKPVDAVPCTPLDGKPCLFDIDSDPCEYNNLADKMPEKVEKLLTMIEEYRAVAVKPLNLDIRVVIDPQSNPKFWNCTITNWKDFPFDPTKISSCPAKIF